MNPSFLAPSVGNSVPDLGATARTISSTNVYLTPSSLGFQNIAMTVLGQSVFLPPSYANVPGPNTYSIKNSGTYAFGVRDSTGVLLTAISPSGSAIFLLDNSGNWSYTGTALQPGLVTADFTQTASFTNTILAPYVTFDANTSVHCLGIPTGGFNVFVADNIAKTFSTPVNAFAVSPPVAFFKISSTQFIVFAGTTGTNTHFAATFTLTGSSPNYSVSIAAAATLTVGSAMPAWGGETSLSQPHIAQLSPTLYVAAFVTGANTSVVAISVSGTTTTIGAIANISTANSVSDTVTCYPITATTALVIYNTSVGTPNINAVVISVSGTTCTVNLPTSIPGTNNTSIAASTCQLTATKFLILVNASTTSAIINAITVAGGTAVSVGAGFTLETLITGFNNSTPTGTEGPGYSQSGATRYNPRLFPLSSTTALIWYMDSSQISRCAILTENAGTVTGGTILYRSISASGTSSSESGLFLPPGVSEFISIKQDGNPSGITYKHRLVSHRISGTAITVGQATPVDTLNSQVTIQTHVAARMGSGDYVLGLSGGSVGPAQTLAVFRSNGDAFTLRGSIDVPALVGYNYAVAQPSSNRLVLIGSTLYSGNNDSTGATQPRILNVEFSA